MIIVLVFVFAALFAFQAFDVPTKWAGVTSGILTLSIVLIVFVPMLVKLRKDTREDVSLPKWRDDESPPEPEAGNET